MKVDTFKLLNNWPRWEKNFVNLIGEKFSGKTHLINECKNNLTHYELYDGQLYGCERVNAVEILSSPNKKIVSSLCNPFEKFDIEQPDECVIIDMNDIRF